MPVSRCPMCRNPVIQAGTGRPARWCSDACRYRGHTRLRTLRKRLRAAEEEGLARRAEYLREWINRLEK